MVLLAAAGLCLGLVGPVVAADPSPTTSLAFPKPQEIVAVDRAEWLGEKLATNPYMLASKDDEVSPGNYDYKDATGGLFHFYGHDISGPYVNRTDVCPFILDHNLAGLGTGVWDADIPNVTAEECAAASPAAASPAAASPPEQIQATTTSITGDVEYSRDGGKTFLPLTVGTLIEQGFRLRTGFDAAVRLNFGYGELSVPQLTSLRIDEYTSSNNLQKTQLYLEVGTVAARVTHTNAPRSDFSVATPSMANASIRDSEMVVIYAKEHGLTTVYTVEDLAYVKGVSGAPEIQVLQGQKVVVAPDGTASTPTAYTAAELPLAGPFDPASGAGGSGAGAGGSAGTGQSGDIGGSSGGPFLAAAIAAIAVIAVGGLLARRARGRRLAD